jgi:hypothetical protein
MSDHNSFSEASADTPRGEVALDKAKPKGSNRLVVMLSVALCLVVGAAFLYWASTSSETAPTTAGTPGEAQGLKRITLSNFQKEVVAPSETGPVVIEFYSHL